MDKLNVGGEAASTIEIHKAEPEAKRVRLDRWLRVRYATLDREHRTEVDERGTRHVV